jgi:diguanylate cyclase (GGDEF)-like protein
LLARFGGEEFVVALRGIDIAGAARAAERLRRAVAEIAVEFEGQKIAVTVSIGCASTAGPDALGPDALIAEADRRLYAAKHGGRNAVVASG